MMTLTKVCEFSKTRKYNKFLRHSKMFLIIRDHSPDELTRPSRIFTFFIKMFLWSRRSIAGDRTHENPLKPETFCHSNVMSN